MATGCGGRRPLRRIVLALPAPALPTWHWWRHPGAASAVLNQATRAGSAERSRPAATGTIRCTKVASLSLQAGPGCGGSVQPHSAAPVSGAGPDRASASGGGARRARLPLRATFMLATSSRRRPTCAGWRNGDAGRCLAIKSARKRRSQHQRHGAPLNTQTRQPARDLGSGRGTITSPSAAGARTAVRRPPGPASRSG